MKHNNTALEPIVALMKLANELSDAHIEAVRQALGNTNAAVLKLRRDEADAVIAAHHSGVTLVDGQTKPLSGTAAPLVSEPAAQQPESFHQTSASGVSTVQTALRGSHIKANWFHGTGAYARCSYCQRYSDDPATLSYRQPLCDCGEKHGWSGSFVPPTADSKWSGTAKTEPMNGADNEVQQPNKTDLAAPAVLPLLPEDREARMLTIEEVEDVDCFRLEDTVLEAIVKFCEVNGIRLSNQPPKGTT